MFVRFRSQVYFDRKIFKTNWKRINEFPLKRAGLLVRKYAVQSVRKRKWPTGNRKPKPSPAGQPPRSRSPGHPYRRIFSVPNSFSTSVYVGFLGLHKNTTPTPAVHEYGMAVVRRVLVEKNTNVRNRKTGRFQKKQYKIATKLVKYPKRPTMEPALKKAKSKLPALWHNSIRG